MAYKGVLEDINKCISLDEPSRVPVFAISTQFDNLNLGISQRDYERDFDKMVSSSLESVKKFDYDWVLLHPDDYIELEGIVDTVEKDDDSIPVMPKNYIQLSEENLKKFQMPDFRNDFRMPVYLDAMREVKNRLGDDICLTGRLATPFAVATLVFGISDTMISTIENSDILFKAIDFFTELQIDWGIEQAKAGADAIWIGDCTASSNFISTETYQKFSAPGVNAVSKEIKKYGCIAYYHAAEKSPSHLKLMPDIGVDIVNIGEGIDIKEAKELIGDKICISGNLSPIEVLVSGTVDDVKAEVQRIVTSGKSGGGYIFNTEEGIISHTPIENVQAMIETVREYGKY
jgi:uroporphyrinogen decarboxylase